MVFSQIQEWANYVKMDVPPPSSLPGSSVAAPHPHVYNGGWMKLPFETYLIQPYPGKLLRDKANVYNYGVSCARARRCI